MKIPFNAGYTISYRVAPFGGQRDLAGPPASDSCHWAGRSLGRQEPGQAGAWAGRSLGRQEPGPAGAWAGRSLGRQEPGPAARKIKKLLD